MFAALAILGWSIWLLLLGLTICIFLFRFLLLSKRRASLAYEWDGRIIVGKEKENLPEEIKTAMKEAGSPYICVSEIVFWNAGRRTFHRADIVETDPLRLGSWGSNRKILRIAIRSAIGGGKSFSVQPSATYPYAPLCTFDYLEPGDGVRFELLQTGVSYAQSMYGQVRGLPGGLSHLGRAKLVDSGDAKPSRWARLWPYFYFILPVLLLILDLWVVFHNRHKPGWIFRRGKLAGLEFLLLPFFYVWWGFALATSKLLHLYGRYPRTLSKI
jgi:hypothetical protein